MATAWVPAVTAGIGAIGGQAVGALFQGRNKERSEQRQRREQAIEVLAQVKALLIDANPQRLAYNASEETFTETFSALRERWQQARIPLLKLGASSGEDPWLGRRACNGAVERWWLLCWRQFHGRYRQLRRRPIRRGTLSFNDARFSGGTVRFVGGRLSGGTVDFDDAAIELHAPFHLADRTAG